MLSDFLHVVGVAPCGQQKFTTSGQAFLVIIVSLFEKRKNERQEKEQR